MVVRRKIKKNKRKALTGLPSYLIYREPIQVKMTASLFESALTTVDGIGHES